MIFDRLDACFIEATKLGLTAEMRQEVMEMKFNPKKFGPLMGNLIDPQRPPALGKGCENRESRDDLENWTIEAAFGDTVVVDADMAMCCHSGLWLYHNFLHQSHEICQRISSVEGSFWHGIMHRRDGDYSNSKTWFRQVGNHSIYSQLAIASRSIAEELGSDWNPSPNHWDAAAFVDLCQAAGQGPADLHRLGERVALIEWQLLFEFCYDRATTQAA